MSIAAFMSRSPVYDYERNVFLINLCLEVSLSYVSIVAHSVTAAVMAWSTPFSLPYSTPPARSKTSTLKFFCEIALHTESFGGGLDP